VTPQERAGAVRRRVGLFRLPDRGVVEVRGGDRRRWLDGMVSNDVASLSAAGPGNGCYALLLTREGRIVADLHVIERADCHWLEATADGARAALERLAKYVIADDVALRNATGEHARLAVEGPRACAVVAAAAGRDETDLAAVPPDCAVELEVAGAAVVAAAFGFSGEAALQIFAPPASADDVAARLRAAGAAHGLVEGDAETLEILRVEAGIPRLGAELSEDVLPAEVGLDGAASATKGCYTGQEVVARMRSRGQVGHHLVGLVVEGAGSEAIERGAEIRDSGRAIGEVTSSVHASLGRIALGFVRRGHAEPGARVEVAGHPARIAPLPFVSRACAAS
jgi:folate-binding protein YgfZ